MRSIIESVYNTLCRSDSIGIFVSGGFDSTVLSSLVFQQISEHNLACKITLFTVPRHDDSLVHSERISGWLKMVYPKVCFEKKIVGDPDLHHSKQVSSGIKEILGVDNNIAVIIGDTLIPPKLSNNGAPVRKRSFDPKIIQPLFDYDKTMSLLLAKELNQLEAISKITHTCTENKTLRCNKCWQCLERSWAFKNLNINDVGRM